MGDVVSSVVRRLWIVLLLAGCSGGAPPPVPRPLALRGLTLIDGTGGPPRPAHTLLVEGGELARIGPDAEVAVPPGAEVLDLSGKWALPGFVDVHAHMPAPEHQARVLRTLLAFGVTTARSPAAVPETGVLLRGRLERGELPGPRFLSAGRLIDAPGSPWGFAAEVATEAEARAEVARQAAEGVDFVKLYSQLPPRLVEAAVREARARGLRTIGHMGRTTWGEAVELGVDSLTHSFVWGFAHSVVPEGEAERFAEFFLPNPGFDPRLFGPWSQAVDYTAERFERLAGQLVSRRIAVDPNLVLAEAVAWGDDPAAYARLQTELDAVPHAFPHPYSARWSAAQREAARAAFSRLLEGIGILHARGVLLTAGTDLQNPWMTPGVSLHREMELLARAGIPAAGVLRIASRNGAEALGLAQRTGTLEAGKSADVVVLEADPLADVSRTRAIHLVVRAGRVHRPRELLAGTSP